MTRHIQHIINATGDGEITRLSISDSAIASQVILALEVSWVVAFHEALGVTPDGANHGRPWALDHQDTALAIGHVFACFVHDGGLNARERQRARSGHHGCHARQWGDHVTTRFGLPEGVDNGAIAAAHMLVVPLPCGGVDGLAHRTQQAQTCQVVALWMHFIFGFSRFDQRTNGGRCRVENRDLVVLNHFPETSSVRKCGHALKHNFSAAQGQRAVGDVGVSCHPSNVGRAPEHVVWFQVEGPLGGQGCVQQVAASRVLYTFGFACGARGVKQEQGMLSAHPFGLASAGLLSKQFVHPSVTACRHGHIGTAALDHQHIFDAAATAQCNGFVHNGFQRQLFATANLMVGCDDGLGARVFNAIAQ